MRLIPIKKRKSFNGKICNDIAKYLKGNELRLYIMLCQYHNDEYDYAFPTYKQIREYFDKSWDDKNIRKYLVGLEEKGFIKIGKNVTKTGSNNIYEVFGVETLDDSFKRNEEVIILKNKINGLEGEARAFTKSLSRFKHNEEYTSYIEGEIEIINNEIEKANKEINAIKKSLEGQSSRD